MKRFLILVLCAAMLLRICGSSLVFAEEEEGLEVIVSRPGAECNKSIDGDVSDAETIFVKGELRLLSEY